MPGATPAAQQGAAHVEEPVAYDAILLAGFGGPEGQDDVIPFLRNVTSGRGIPDERLEEVAHHYRHFGGVSPINEQNRQLKAALEAELASRGIDLPVLWGNRNWDPYLNDALDEAKAAGHTKLIAIATSAYSSYSSCRQYREDFADALADTGLGDGPDAIQIDKVRQFFDHPGLRAAVHRGRARRDRAARGIRARPGPHHAGRGAVRHPLDPLDGCREVGSGRARLRRGRGVRRPAPRGGRGGHARGRRRRRAVAARVPVPQRRRPSMPWLEPDINDAIAELPAAGRRAVVIVPLGFVSDHMEVLWDLDNEALETAGEHGLAAVRVPTPGTHPAYVAGLVDLVLERVNGTPVAERPAVTELGPWYDVCRPGCCENVRLGFRPALAGIAP